MSSQENQDSSAKFNVSARFSFAGEGNDGTLAFTKGDSLVVTKVDPETGWYFGEDKSGRGGWIPTNLVSKVNSDGEAFSDAESVAFDVILEEGVCYGCRMDIGSDEYIEASGGRQYHEECFKCSVCEKSVLDEGFVESQNQIYCPDCYRNGFLPHCKMCSGSIEGKFLKAMDNEYHRDCFVCTVCKNPFPDLKFHRFDGNPYCKSCFLCQHALKCLRCDKGISGDMFEALNGYIHPDCFRCAVEGHRMEAGQIFHEYDDSLYCHEHFTEQVLEKCFVCGNEMEGDFFLLKGTPYHLDCFKCVKCSKQIKHSLFDFVNDQVHCIQCGKTEKALSSPMDGRYRTSRASAVKAPEVKQRIEESRAKFGNLSSKIAHIFTQDDANKVTSTDEIDETRLPVYSYEQLIDLDKCPPDVILKRKELHLSDEQFKDIFLMDKESFKLLKFWKQKQLKQNLLLF